MCSAFQYHYSLSPRYSVRCQARDTGSLNVVGPFQAWNNEAIANMASEEVKTAGVEESGRRRDLRWAFRMECTGWRAGEER